MLANRAISTAAIASLREDGTAARALSVLFTLSAAFEARATSPLAAIMESADARVYAIELTIWPLGH